MDVLYLHGFASSARSSKASFFAAKLAEHGVALRTPDLNEPDFSTLTITRMIEQVGRVLASAGDAPAALIGSSLGGFVALQAARQHPSRVTRLVLLAPALDFGANRMRELGPGGLERWEATNALNVFHYGYGRVIPVHYDLYRDAQLYEPGAAEVSIPVQVFQGRRDTAVDPESVRSWCTARPHVELHMLDDDHQLLGSLDYIWGEMRRFLGLAAYQQIP